MFDNSETNPLSFEITAAARQMRDEAVAKMLATGWKSLGRFAARLMHVAHLPQHGQPGAR